MYILIAMHEGFEMSNWTFTYFATEDAAHDAGGRLDCEYTVVEAEKGA